MHEEYGELSTLFYELTKPVGHSLEGDIEYYLGKLQGTKGRVLEAGVGTGRVLIPLLLNGFIADGVDSSAEKSSLTWKCRHLFKRERHRQASNRYPSI